VEASGGCGGRVVACCLDARARALARVVSPSMVIATKRGPFEIHDRGKGMPVVLLHGFPFDAESWTDEVDTLAATARVVAPSMRGFGRTPPREMENLSVDVMADDVAAMLDALGVREPAVLVGLSMGGYVTLAFARKHPRRIRAVVLADTRAEPDSAEGRASRDRAIARVEGGDLAGFVTDLLPAILAPLTRAERPAVVERVRAMAMRAEPSSVIAMLRALRDRPDARPGLSSIEAPVQVIVGAEDALIPVAASQALADGIPAGRASLHVVPGAGHLSNLEAPEAFRAVLTAFLARV
jgi:3-oxoadipate enol-lactonase